MLWNVGIYSVEKKMSSLIVLGSLMFILYRLDLSTAAGTTIGKLFLLAVPRMMTKFDDSRNLPRIVFYMFTAENNKFKVEFHVYWLFDFDSTLFSRVFHITKGQLIEHEVGDELINFQTLVSPQFSFGFEGEDKFGLSVLLYDNLESASMITAIPVTSWGTSYYAFTLDNYPAIHVSTYEGDNSIVIKLRMTVPSYTILGKKRQDGDEIVMNFLRSKESIQISFCGKTIAGKLSGTFIRGTKPIGVVSGNCMVTLQSPSCTGNSISNNITSTDNMAEMLLPSSSFGKEFVLFTLQLRKPLSFYEVMAKYNDTHFSTFTSVVASTYNNYSIARAGDTVQIHLKDRGHSCVYLRSKKPVQVVHIQNAACYYDDKKRWEDLGDSSLSLMIPIELFYFFYVWGIPILGSGVNSYVVVIVRLLHSTSLYINEKFAWESIDNDIDWKIGQSQDEDRLSYNTIQVGSYQYFGCYIYAVAYKYGYMRPAGAMITTIHENCVKTLKNMTVSDLIDNDCDGRVDEEKEDGKDDDSDNEIDEDIGAVIDKHVKKYREMIKACPPFTFGWNCSLRCPNCLKGCTRDNGSCSFCRGGYKNAALGCNQVCDANEYGEDCTGDCSVKCAGKDCFERILGLCKDCPEGYWGKDCLQSCPNCVGTCNVSTGVCNKCKAGFKNSWAGCNKECDDYEYGEDCLGNCRVKCNGKDCSDRTTGDCLLCNKYQWGNYCENYCSNCEDSCHPITGACQVCKFGFKNPEKGCTTPCVTGYGINCNSSCLEKCNGKECFERRFGECKKCPNNTWGLHCKERCFHCKDDCDKSFGTCYHCKPGFKSPQTGCNTSCLVNEYGEDCAGNCIEKCGHDCAERVYGTCTVDKNASLSLWGDWHCSQDCSDKSEYRERVCIADKCDKTEDERRESRCYVNVKCPGDCPPFFWGSDCQKNCENCKTSCDKYIGSCDTCKPGYKNSSFGCNKECESYEYGEDCRSDCKVKCKQNDCYERANGTCKVDGEFGQWSEWTCTKECNSKEEVRIRLCNNPMPAFGGLECFGKEREVRAGECLYAVPCSKVVVSWPFIIIIALVVLLLFVLIVYLFFPRRAESVQLGESYDSHPSRYIESESVVESEFIEQ